MSEIINPFMPSSAASVASTSTPPRSKVKADEAQGTWTTGYQDSRVSAEQGPALPTRQEIESRTSGPVVAAEAPPPPKVEVEAPRPAAPSQLGAPIAMFDEPATITALHSDAQGVSEGAAKLSGFARVGTFVALALTGLGIAQGLMPATAMAATPAPVSQSAVMGTTSAREVRNTQAVQASSIQEIVDNFSAENQLYVKGHPALNGTPLSKADMQAMSDVLKAHPHSYVVLVDATTNVQGDDMKLSTGIGNSKEFQGVVNQQTGERDGTVYMIYYNVNNDASARKIFMRAESLPDKLGVGEQNFADPNTGQPRELLNIFIDNFKNQGKGIPGSLDAVMTKVDKTIEQHVNQTVGAATQAVSQARGSLNSIEANLQQFRSKHGADGTISNPNIKGWEATMAQAESALAKRDFATASSLTQQLQAQLRTQEQAMTNYAQAPTIAQDVEKQIKVAEGQVKDLGSNGEAQSARQHLGTAKEQLQQYQAAYTAKDPGFFEHLQSAKGEATQATQQAQASQDSADRVKNIRNYGSAALGLTVVALGVIANRRAAAGKKKAETELDEAINSIGEKSKELLALMEQSDYRQVANYEGKTKALANELMANVTDALTLVGGAHKFLAEAEKLVHPSGAGALKNLFLRGNYDKAVDLLTNPEHKLTFSFLDSSRAVMEKESKASSWRDQLTQAGATREFQKSMQEVLLAMADNRDKAKDILAEIEKKDSNISKFLGDIQEQGNAIKEKHAQLVADAVDKLFAAPAVSENLLPMVLESKDKGGLVAKGLDIKVQDPVRAWDEFGETAKRMTADAGQIVSIGMEARSSLVPTLGKADEALLPQQVKTQWAHDATQQLSDRLDKAASTAMRTSAAKDLDGIKLDVARLETRIETAVDQDKERREVSPDLISGAEQDVATARDEIAKALQGAGAFKGGKPEQVLREPERDPSARTQGAHQNLDAVKPSLDTGDVETAGTHLTNVRDLSADAHRLVKETRDALAAYPSTLSEREKRNESIDKTIGDKYQPSFDRIRATYAPEVLQLVAPDVGDKSTIADNIADARHGLDQGHALDKEAQGNFDKAFLLSARDCLAHADEVLKTSQSQLDQITSAETLLADRQHKVEAQLATITGALGTTRTHANQAFVRDQARGLLRDAEAKLAEAKKAVEGSPKNPYKAKEALDVAENTRTQVETAIAADKRAYDTAVRSIQEAESSISSAQAAIAAASMQNWHYSSSEGSARESVSMGDLMMANSTLSNAHSELNNAQSLLRSQRYEDADRAADQASSTAHNASSAASMAIASAKSRFDSQVHVIKQREYEAEQAERRRREAQEAEDRRARESSSSGSSGGGFSGGGGSGSTGGSF